MTELLTFMIDGSTARDNAETIKSRLYAKFGKTVSMTTNTEGAFTLRVIISSNASYKAKNREIFEWVKGIASHAVLSEGANI